MKEFVEKRELVSESYFHSQKPVHLDLKKGRTSHPEARTTKITVAPTEIYDGNFFIPEDVKTATRNVSQLGLKELWAGGTAMRHNRWDHSCGVFNVGMIWMSSLRQAKRVPHLRSCFPPPLRSWLQVTTLVGMALLLHDYGHLPFSHLLDEVLKWMHWVPDEYEEWGSEAADQPEFLYQHE